MPLPQTMQHSAPWKSAGAAPTMLGTTRNLILETPDTMKRGAPHALAANDAAQRTLEERWRRADDVRHNQEP